MIAWAQNSHWLPRIFIFVLAAQILLFFAYSIYGLQLGYSYWLDELFSVISVQYSFKIQILDLYLHDVHPPLYQIILYFWTVLFGESELSTRALSFLFSLFCISSLFFMGCRFSKQITILFGVLLFCNFNLYYYAQETRSYGMLLSLSTWSLVLLVSRERRYIFFVLIALGLTHYFGTLVASITLLALLIEGRNSRAQVIRSILTGGLILVWPILFVIYGSAQFVSGGNFWIDTTPADSLLVMWETASPALHMLTAGLADHFGPAVAVIAAILVVAAVFAVSYMAYRHVQQPEKAAIVFSAFILVVAAAGVFTISFHTPIATERNFVAVVPQAALLGAIAISFLLKTQAFRALAVAFTLILVSLSQYKTFLELSEKTRPHENWKEPALQVMSLVQEKPETRVFVFADFSTEGADAHFIKVFGYYFPNDMNIKLINKDKLSTTQANDVIYFGHVEPTDDPSNGCKNSITDYLDAENLVYRAFFPYQTLVCSNGYLQLLSDKDRD